MPDRACLRSRGGRPRPRPPPGTGGVRLAVAIFVYAGVTQIEQTRQAGWHRLPESASR